MSTLPTASLLGSIVPVGSSHWDFQRFPGRDVQFYEKDIHLLDGLSRFVGAALLTGDAALIIATQSQREGLSAHLSNRGLDLTPAMREGRFLSFDSAETLSKFMVDGTPDPALFTQFVADLVGQLAATESGKPRRVAVYGDMVTLLWTSGQQRAAVQLERLWNQLARTHSFQLHCAYPLSQFSREQDRKSILEICAEQVPIVPPEQFTTSINEQERSQAVLVLQQKAQALEAEIEERKRIQFALQERENEISNFLENAIVGIHWVGADGTVLWANRAELKLLGYEREEYIGRHISEFHADVSVIDDILLRLGRNEELRDHEARLRCKDGSIRYVRIHSNVLMRNGQFIHTRCFTTDVTEKRESELALFRMAAIVESSEDAIISKDLDGIITSWNAAAQRIFGYEAEEAVGQFVTLLIPPESMDEENFVLSNIRGGKRIEHFETIRMRKNGERIHVSLTVSPVKDARGNIIGAAKIVRDISRRKTMEASLHVSERLASVGRLAATVAHEINNPLEAVTNFIYLAKQHPDAPEEVRNYLNSADEELRRVAHIAQQTLGFYRDDSKPVPRNVMDIVQSVLTVYDRKCQYKALKVEQDIEPNLMVTAVQGELKQILSNLIANAIDASKENGRVLVRAATCHHFPSGDRGVRITIADEGIGITQENKKKLFTPFFTTKPAVGTGLGLWITKDLVEKQGGHIRYRSSDSDHSGTVMSIYLP